MSSHAPPIAAAAPAPRKATRSAARCEDAARARPWIRALSFAALALYGVDRWGRLMHDPPAWRLLGLAGAAVALATLVPLLRHLTAGWPARAGGVLSGAVALALGLAVFPISGLRWHWVWHLQIADSARAVGHGLGALADVLVPYLGHAYSVRLVVMLGAAVLLLDAAAVLATGPRALGDGRRAAAALPLIALAVVPSTLVRPEHPALQGLLLFALLALFLWGERIGRDGAAAAVAIACVAGVLGAVVAPRIDSHHPWVDYRAWTGATTAARLDTFDWNQSYGPLRWPQSGHEVLTVLARGGGDYWKAQDLSSFNGTDWVVGSRPAPAPALPSPSTGALRAWTHPARVTIQGMETSDVIAGSGVTEHVVVPGGAHPGAQPGTWIANRPLTPGTSYFVDTYSPSPSPRQLAGAGRRYPWAALASDLTLALPIDARGGPAPRFTFAGFHARGPAVTAVGAASGAVGYSGGANAAGRLAARSPYAPAETLARRLAEDSPTPYAFVAAVKRYLDDGSYTYDQNPPRASEPLLDFLFHSRAGYCQQFSGAMAMLLRMGGVPARVAAGFTPGAFDNEQHTWTVSDIDAHAWVEAWFPRYGWVKFDPTPTSAPARGGKANVAVGKRLPNLKPNASTGSSSTATVHAGAVGSTPRGGSGGGGAGGGDPWPYVGGAAGLLALVAAAWWLARRAGVRADPVSELERALSRTGRPLREGTTLAALEHRFRSAPDAAAYLRALRMERYGATPTAPTTTQRRALRAELRAGLGLSGRLRALWALPPRPPRPPRPLRSGAHRPAGGD